MVIALQATIHDCSVSLLSNSFSCNIFVHPIWVSPHGRVNLAEFDGRTREVGYCLFEGRIEVSIVEEDIRIVKPTVEVSFHGADGIHDTRQLLISCQNDEHSICAWLTRVRLQASRHEDLVVLLADSPARR